MFCLLAAPDEPTGLKKLLAAAAGDIAAEFAPGGPRTGADGSAPSTRKRCTKTPRRTSSTTASRAWATATASALRAARSIGPSMTPPFLRADATENRPPRCAAWRWGGCCSRLRWARRPARSTKIICAATRTPRWRWRCRRGRKRPCGCWRRWPPTAAARPRRCRVRPHRLERGRRAAAGGPRPHPAPQDL